MYSYPAMASELPTFVRLYRYKHWRKGKMVRAPGWERLDEIQRMGWEPLMNEFKDEQIGGFGPAIREDLCTSGWLQNGPTDSPTQSTPGACADTPPPRG